MKMIKNNEGASAVEFAIILPILVMLVFGIIDFGIYIYDKSMITNASREGARYGILYNTNSDGIYSPHTETEIRTYVLDVLTNKLITLGGSSPTPTVTFPNGVPSSGGELSVQVTYDFTSLVMPSFLPTLGSITSTTVMRMEYPL